MDETKRPLCGKHGEEWSAWLDYRLPPGPVMLVGQAGADLTARGVMERQELRSERWRDTIRSSQLLITEACAAGLSCGPSTPDRVLALQMPDSSIGATTVRAYLARVLGELFRRGESFSPSRPFGGDRSYGFMDEELIIALEDSGQFGLSKHSDYDKERKARKLIADAIRRLGEESR